MMRAVRQSGPGRPHGSRLLPTAPQKSAPTIMVGDRVYDAPAVGMTLSVAAMIPGRHRAAIADGGGAWMSSMVQAEKGPRRRRKKQPYPAAIHVDVCHIPGCDIVQLSAGVD